ncbi:MAG: hypothetical protein ABJ242_09785 [Marinomonas sp.]
MKYSHVILLSSCLAIAACGDTAGNETAEESASTPPTEEVAEAAVETTEDAAAKEAVEEPAKADGELVARPVRYGIEAEELDACGSVGEVSGLKAGGDNFLSVRAVPSTSAAEIDRLLNGASVIMCEYDGDWVGIVYDKSGEKDCGTGSPIPEETTYTGVCDSGWISKDYVTLMAG